MPLNLAPLTADPEFAALATGLDLSCPISASDIAAIDAAMDCHAVLVFRGQPLGQAEQVAFAEQFGPLDLGLKRLKKQPERLEKAELMDISNLDLDGRPAARDSRKVVSNIANQLWHSDSSFQATPVKYSMLSAVRLTSWGGATEFADLRAAYDALDARMKAEIAALQAEHFALHSRFMLGDDDYTPEQRNQIPPVLWPLVRELPYGRRALFVGVHARAIQGLTLAEGRMLLMDLLEHATQPRFVYAHEWQVGDLVIWDNRATVHRGRRYDMAEPRELRRTTTVDVQLAASRAA
jgi:alpha-ketoglutarate-dependent 2,4-dichlorophenoxyacetate dioxygenase